MRRIEIIAFTAAAFAFATPALAQGRGNGKAGQRTTTTVQRDAGDIFGRTRTTGTDRVPPGHLPPPGMCRVWIDGVPPGHQPPVTDCATAQMQRQANSRVIYGDDTPFPGKGRRSSDVANGRIVNIGGRQCVERTDRNGNVRYECQDGRYDPTRTDRGRVYGRDDDNEDRVYRRENDDGGVYGRREDDRDRDEYVNRGAGNAGKAKAKHNGNKGQGKHGRG